MAQEAAWELVESAWAVMGLLAWLAFVSYRVKSKHSLTVAGEHKH
jgi:hypothetical protein